jgi:hypothetical protein
MTQYQDPFAQPYMDPTMKPKKTSGLAITALVFSLLGIIPCCGAVTAPIGALLGLIGAAILGPNAAKKGRGMSIAAFIIGLILIAAQIAVGRWGYNTMWKPVVDGPAAALTAASSGHVTAFKSHFHGDGASAPDAEAQTFLDELSRRYGAFVRCHLDEAAMKGQQPPFGQPQVTFPYQIEFQNKTVSAEAEMIFSDPARGGFVMKWGFITIFDPDLGDLTYPSSAAGNP